MSACWYHEGWAVKLFCYTRQVLEYPMAVTQEDTSYGSTCIALSQFMVISPSLLWIGRNISPQTTDEQRFDPAPLTLPDLRSLAIPRASLKLHWYNLCKQLQPIKLFPGEFSSPRKVDNVLISVKHSLAFCMQAIEWAGKSRRMCIEKTQCSPLAMWEDWHIIMFRNNNCTSSTSTTYLINVKKRFNILMFLKITTSPDTQLVRVRKRVMENSLKWLSKKSDWKHKELKSNILFLTFATEKQNLKLNFKKKNIFIKNPGKAGSITVIWATSVALDVGQTL